jgi:hypothetical protein
MLSWIRVGMSYDKHQLRMKNAIFKSSTSVLPMAQQNQQGLFKSDSVLLNKRR